MDVEATPQRSVQPALRPAHPVETPPASRRHSKVALLPEEPPGTVFTRNAGSIYVEAVLWCRNGEDVSFGELPSFGDARSYLVEGGSPTSGKQILKGEIRALSEPALRSALDTLMRHLTTGAALLEAVLETRAERRAPVTVAPATAVGALARVFYEAGRRVRLSGCWSPLPAGAGIAVGVKGAEAEIERLLLEHPAWEILR